MFWGKTTKQPRLEVGRGLEQVEEGHGVEVQRLFHELRPIRAERLHGQGCWWLDNLLAGGTLDLGDKIRERTQLHFPSVVGEERAEEPDADQRAEALACLQLQRGSAASPCGHWLGSSVPVL